MARCHIRCSKCQARRCVAADAASVAKLGIDGLRRLKPCPCGSKRFYIDKWMNSRDTRAMACSCSGYVYLTRRQWPHRKGSKFCWYRADGTQRMPGDPDFRDLQYEEIYGFTDPTTTAERSAA